MTYRMKHIFQLTCMGFAIGILLPLFGTLSAEPIVVERTRQVHVPYITKIQAALLERHAKALPRQGRYLPPVKPRGMR